MGMVGKMEGRVIAMEEKLSEVSKYQMVMESKIEIQFREAKAARTELGEKVNSLANQVL